MKKCTRCLESKKLELFHKDKRSPSGYASWCLACYSKLQKEKSRTYQGRILRMWYSVVLRCQYKLKKQNTKVKFTREEFVNFIDKKTNYKEVYKKWVENDFVYRLTPTPDRIDSKGDYEASNLQVLSLADNTAKANRDNPPRKRCRTCNQYIKRLKSNYCSRCRTGN